MRSMPAASSAAQIIHADAVHAFEGEHRFGRVRPEHFRHDEIVAGGEVAPEQARVRAFALQVELVRQRGFDLGHDLERADLVCRRMPALRQLAECTQQVDIGADARVNLRSQHLDHDVAAVGQLRRMHLGDRGRRQRRLVEHFIQCSNRRAERRLDRRTRLRAGKRRYLVLQQGQFVGDIGGQ